MVTQTTGQANEQNQTTTNKENPNVSSMRGYAYATLGGFEFPTMHKLQDKAGKSYEIAKVRVCQAPPLVPNSKMLDTGKVSGAQSSHSVIEAQTSKILRSSADLAFEARLTGSPNSAARSGS